jgi:hypothetical protein
MDKSQINDYIDTGVKIGILGVIVIYFRRITSVLYSAIAGKDKIVSLIELGAVWGVWRLDFMLRTEAGRQHEWNVFSVHYIIGMLIFILLCFGFRDIVTLFITRKLPENENGQR